MVGTIYPARDPAVRGAAERAREGAAVHRAQHRRRRATRSGSTTITSRRAFDYNEQPRPPATVASDSQTTLDNARLWDPRSSRATYSARPGARRPTTSSPTSTSTATRSTARARRSLIAARELNRADLPRSTWANRHLVYTHGYGAVAAPANAANADGQPNYLLSRHPARRASSSVDSTGPRSTSARASAATRSSTRSAEQEVDYDGEARPTHVTRYKGTGGVKLSSFAAQAPRSRCASATGTCWSRARSTTNSRVLLRARHHATGCRSVAPFLKFDADPYPVDRRRPDRVGARRLHDDQQLPVLAVADARQRGSRGSARLQLRAQLGEGRRSTRTTARSTSTSSTRRTRSSRRTSQAFPDLFTDGSRDARRRSATTCATPRTSSGRRPSMYGRYHITDPAALLRRQRQLGGRRPTRARPSVARPPRRVGGAGDGNNGGRNTHAARRSGSPIDPLYLHDAAARRRDRSEEFVLERPFVPRREGATQLVGVHRRANPTATTTASSMLVRGARQSDAPSPGRRRRRSSRPTTIISSEFTLLDQHGLAGRPGRRAAHPDRRLDPLRAAGLRPRARATRPFPRFQFVVVVYGEHGACCDTTSSDAVDQLLGSTPASAATRRQRRTTGDRAADHHDRRRRARPPTTCSPQAHDAPTTDAQTALGEPGPRDATRQLDQQLGDLDELRPGRWRSRARATPRRLDHDAVVDHDDHHDGRASGTQATRRRRR